MKKTLLFCAALLAMTARAEVFTLDLSTATDFNSQPVQFETKSIPVWNGNMTDVWDSTYAAGWTNQYIMANYAKFMFEHAASVEYGDYSYYQGFTVSKVASDTLNQFACAAKGGIAGVGTPFLVSYGDSSAMSFNGEYYPQEVQICQSAYALRSMRNGDSFAKKFTKDDKFTLTIYGLDNVSNKTNCVVYHLAADGVFNEGWTRVDLSPIGACMGLKFFLTSTDNGQFGMNTPAYFALDGMKISEDKTPTDNIMAADNDAQAAQKVVVNGQICIIRNGIRYTLQGQRADKVAGITY